VELITDHEVKKVPKCGCSLFT